MAATSTLFPTTVAGTTGSTWTTTANATGSGTGTTAAAWAVFTNATNGGSGATGTISLSGYAAQAAGPASTDTITSVVLSLRGNVAATNRWTAASCTAQLFSGTTAIGSPVAVGALSTSTSNVWTITFSGANAPTYAQLADLRVQVTAVHTSTTSSTFNVDTAGLVVNYSPPAPPTVNAGTDDDHLVSTLFARTATENSGGASITARLWTIVSGPTGAGSTVGTAAALSWTPTVTGTYVLRYSATNSVGTGTADITLYVEDAAAVNDTFTRTNASDPGVTDSGQEWIPRNGTWGTNGSALLTNTGTDGNIASVLVGTATQVVRATMPAAPISGPVWGILARYESVGTYYLAEVDGAGVAAIKRFVNGTFTGTIATSAAGAVAGANNVIELSVAEEGGTGTRTIFNLNGVQLLTGLDTGTRPLNGIRSGVRLGGTGTALRWDDFQVNYTTPTGGTLVVKGARSATRASRPLLGQVSSLTVRAARSADRASRPLLTQQQPTLTVRAARNATRAGRPLLTQQQGSLVRAARSVARTSRPLLTQQQATLTITGSRATTRTSRALLTQATSLTVAAARAHTRTGPALLAQDTPLTIRGARATATASHPVLSQHSPLTIRPARAATRAQDARLAAAGQVAVYDTRMQTRASRPRLTQDTPLTVHGARTATRTATATLTSAAPTLTIRGARSQTRAAVAALEQLQLLTVAGARAPARALRVILTGTAATGSPARTYTVPADNRTTSIAPDNRTVSVPPDPRTVHVAAEDRTHTVPAATRILTSA